MILTHSFFKAQPAQKIKVWVLAPSIHSKDSNIDCYYDFSQSIKEYTEAFAELNICWKWQPVTMMTYRKVIRKIEAEKEEGKVFPIVMNLCDGDEINGTPGISVVKLLSEKDLAFTGSDEYFYNITTSKIPMKTAFDMEGVPNAPWESILNEDFQCNGLFEKLGCPVIVKPSVSGGSMGVGIKNVVENKEELDELVKKMFAGYRGWNLTSDGLIAEKFISGSEFTTLITGSYNHPKKAIVHNPVERVFHPSLPAKEQFLSFDRLWEIYEDESPMPHQENFYEYRVPDADLIEPIKKISWDAYCATKGKGYTRVDIRMDAETKKLYVLEVNAQCGLSDDEDYTSTGAILRLGGKTFAQMIVEILNDSIVRYVNKQRYTRIRNKARA